MLDVALIAPFDPINLSGPTNAPYPPLRLACLAALTRSLGHRTTAIDGVGEGLGAVWTVRGGNAVHGLSIDALLDRTPAAAQVVGVSLLYSTAYPAVAEFVRRLRQRHPAATIVLGGEGVSGIADFIAAELPVDAVVLGEGEPALAALLGALANGRPLDGLANVVTRACPAAQVCDPRAKGDFADADRLPWPDWDGIPLEAYWTKSSQFGVAPFRDPRFLPLAASRGCPFRCRFCTASGVWRGQRYRTVAAVIAELRALAQRYGVAQFSFHDLSLSTDLLWFDRFLDELLAADLRIRWAVPAGLRAPGLTRARLERARRSGLTQLNLPVETGSPRVMAEMEKAMTVDDALTAAREAKAAGLRVQVYYLVGRPSERPEDVLLSLRSAAALARLGVDELIASGFVLLPGSPDFAEEYARGTIRLDDKFFASLFQGHLGKATSRSPFFSGPEVRAIRLLMIAWFYACSFVYFPRKIVALLKGLFSQAPDTMLGRAVTARPWSVAATFRPLVSRATLAVLRRLWKARKSVAAADRGGKRE